MHKTATTVAAIVTIGAGMFYLTTEIGKNLEADRTAKYEHAMKMCEWNKDVMKARDKQAELAIQGKTYDFNEWEKAYNACLKNYGVK